MNEELKIIKKFLNINTLKSINSELDGILQKPLLNGFTRGSIYSVDKNNEFLNNLKSSMNIKTICQDLENQQKWSFSDNKFKVVLVTNYLFREKLNAIFSLVDLNGYIIYETFAIGNEKYGRPSNPNYLLKKNELLLFKPDNFDTIEFFEGLKIENSKKSIVQRLFAKRIS